MRDGHSTDLTAAQVRVLALVADGERSFHGFQRGATLWIDFGDAEIPEAEFQLLIREYLLASDGGRARVTTKGKAVLAGDAV